MQKSKLRLVAWLFSHEVHSMIRLWKSSMLEHWKTLQEGWVNALNTLYDLFLTLDNLRCKGESRNKYMFLQLQYRAKEMQAKFAEISDIKQISAIKLHLRTFASDEKAAKFRCFYCSTVAEISQARWLIETKFRGMRRSFVAKFRARWTRFRVFRTKFRFD